MNPRVRNDIETGETYADDDILSEERCDEKGALWVRLRGEVAATIAELPELPAGTNTIGAVTGASGAALAKDSTLTDGSQVAKRPGRVSRGQHLNNGSTDTAFQLVSSNWSAQDPYTIPDGVQRVTFWLKYTKGGSSSGGYPKVKCLLGNGNEEGAVPIVDPTITVSSTAGRQSAYDNELLLKQLTDANPGTVPLTFDVSGGATKIRLLVAEAGDTAHPGTVLVTLTAGY